MEDYIYAERIGHLLRKAREKSGVSAVAMAKKMHISRGTVDNWENSISSPNITDMFKWFRLLGENPEPYLKEYLHPGCNMGEFSEDTFAKNIAGLSVREKEILNYFISGKHGSSVYAFLNLGLAHLQCPVGMKHIAATVIQMNYNNAEARSELSDPDGIKPDMSAFDAAIAAAQKAYQNNDNGYIV